MTLLPSNLSTIWTLVTGGGVKQGSLIGGIDKKGHGPDDFVKAMKEAGAKDITYMRYKDSRHGVFFDKKKETGPTREAFFARTLNHQPDSDSSLHQQAASAGSVGINVLAAKSF